MKILITGGAGYLGSILAEWLLIEHHEVTVLDNLMHGQDGLIPLCSYHDFHFIHADVRDTTRLKCLAREFDIIIPLAAIVGAPACTKDPSSASEVNLGHVREICKFARKDQIIVFPNTNSGYGNHGGVCTEETSLSPLSVYGSTKKYAEASVLEHGGISLRLATLFGVSYRMRLDLLVNDFTVQALRDRYIVLYEGQFKRNFLHVRDAASAFCFMLDNYDPHKGQAFNVGLSEANISKHELALKVGATLGINLDIITSSSDSDPDKRDYMVSNEKIEKAGWKARLSLEDGIKEVAKAYPLLHKQEYRNA